MSDISKLKQQLEQIYRAGIAAVKGQCVVEQYLQQHSIKTEVFVIAIGKAALSMTQGALHQIGPKIQRGLVITKIGHGYGDDGLDDRFELIEAAHPIPDQSSLEAGDRLLKFIDGLPAQSQVLFLLSGGASSLVEVLAENIAIDDLQSLNQWLLSHDLPIDKINSIRKQCSQIKGGGLIKYISSHNVMCLMISDVPDDDISVIGSGMLVPESSSPALDELPKQIANIISKAQAVPQQDSSNSCNIEYRLIANLAMARQAAAEFAQQLVYQTTVHPEFICGDAIEQGARIANILIAAKPGIHIWAGETTMTLPPKPGIGGRNQSMALSAALTMQGYENCYLLIAATDGSDGPTTSAGALVDGQSIMRGEQAGTLKASDCLAQADAGSFLANSGDLISTGPTGTNVMDLFIGLKVDN